jgi:hypothetical protein
MPTKKKYYTGNVPFGLVKGYGKQYRQQQSWEHSWQDGFEVIPNRQFTAQLEFDAMSRGRSAANFEGILRNVKGWTEDFRLYLEGCHVNIFMVDMLDIVQNTTITLGLVDENIWTFCKRGSNYGLTRVEK